MTSKALKEIVYGFGADICGIAASLDFHGEQLG